MSNRYLSQPQNFFYVRSKHSPVHWGQGMVEFALALPVFLLVAYGVIEFGRLLMTFSAVYSAAREAARYGAAVGNLPGRPAFFRDCLGMKEAAVRVGGMGGVQVSQVTIRLRDMNGGLKKSGSTTVGEQWCNSDTAPAVGIDGGDRIDVTVNTQFWPVLPLVNLPALPVSANSSRTLVHDISPLDAPVKQTYELNIILNPSMGGTVAVNPVKNRYEYGEVVNLTATAKDGFTFTGWSGDQTGTTPVFLTMYSNRTITANFEMIGYKLQVNTGGYGSVALVPPPDMADGRYSFNYTTTPPTYQTVNLTATANPGYALTSWSGTTTSAANTATVLMNSSRTVTANFGAVYTLSVSALNDGFVTAAGLACIDTRVPLNTCVLPANTLVQLSATPLTGSHFQQWVGPADLVIGPLAYQSQIRMTSDKTIQAQFHQSGFALTRSVVGSGTIGVSPAEIPAPDGPFPPGTNVTLTPLPAPGWTFDHWSGVDVPVGLESSNPLPIQMTANKTITATFSQVPYTLIAVSSNPLAGMVSKAPDQPVYTIGNVVTVTASRLLPGWSFDRWTGDVPAGSETAPSLTITMDRSKVVTAQFVQDLYSISLVAEPQGMGTVSPDTSLQTYTYGTKITINVAPADGYEFLYWRKGNSSGAFSYSASVEIEVTASETYVAVLQLIPTPPPPTETPTPPPPTETPTPTTP